MKVAAALFALLATAVSASESSLRHGRQLTFTGRVTALQLYDSNKDTKIVDLVNGTVVNITTLGMSTPSFNINAAVNGTTTRSVAFDFNGAFYRTENLAPFAFCSNNRNDYFKCDKLSTCGTYTVAAKPWSEERARGESGPTVAVTFTIVGCPPPPPPIKITGLSLIDANRDTKVTDLTTNGTVIPLPAGMSSPAFNVNASYTGDVGSVVYFYNGARSRVDDVPPFALCVNDRNDYRSCRRLTCATHTVTAIPYTRDGGSGDAGLPFTVTFTISCAPVPAPVSPPVAAPRAAPVPAPVVAPVPAPVAAPMVAPSAPKAPVTAPAAPVVAPSAPKAPVTAPSAPVVAPSAPKAPSAPVAAPKA